MGSTDSLPVVSQVKSGVQLICGDVEGAAKTQENFIRECPGVSQVTSVVQLVAGDAEGALETQKRCGKAMLNVADGIPVVGHVKGVVHYALGDEEGGDRAMKSATRTTAVIGGGAGGFLVGGPVGAIAGGISGGALCDTTTTLVDSAIHDEFRPSGYIAGIDKVVKNPNPGDVFDLAFMPVGDGLAGYGAGEMVKNVQSVTVGKPDLAKASILETQADVLLESAEAGKMSMTNMEYLNQMKEAQNLFNQAQQLKGKPNAPINLKQTTRSTPTGFVPTTSKRQDDEEPKCICRPIKLKVLFLNVRSINPNNRAQGFRYKIDRITRLIRQRNPNIIAFVETWLQEKHDDELIKEFLGLGDYQIYRQDRRRPNSENAYVDDDTYNPNDGRRGGGILVAFKCADSRIRLVRNPAEDYCDNVMNFDIHYCFDCRNCNSGSRLPRSKKFGFTAVYRRPGPYRREADFRRYDGDFIDRVAHLGMYYIDTDYDGFVMPGDYNWVTDNSTLSYVGGQNLLSQLNLATHIGGNTLDHVIFNPVDFVGSVETTEPVSDHSALIFELKLGSDVQKGERCDRCQN